MGIFDFFKKKETPVKEVSIDQFSGILDSHKKDIEDKISPELSSINLKLNEEKSKLKGNISKLDNAMVKSSLPDRAKQIAEGNREIYIQKIRAFIDEINIPNSPSEIAPFLIKFKESSSNLNKNTAKSHHVMQEVFLNETNAILVTLDKISQLIINLEKLCKISRLNNIESIIAKLDNYNKKTKKIKDIEGEINQNNEEIERNSSKILELSRQIKSLEGSNEHKNLEKLNADKEELTRNINKIKGDFLHISSNLENPLRKYGRLNPENKMIREYMENPFDNLVKDDSIIRIIPEIIELITQGKIEIRAEKRDKTINELKGSDQELKRIRAHYIESSRELEKLSAEINNSQIAKDISRLKDQISSLEEMSKTISNYINKKAKELSQIETDSLLYDLEKSFSEFGEIKIIGKI